MFSSLKENFVVGKQRRCFEGKTLTIRMSVCNTKFIKILHLKREPLNLASRNPFVAGCLGAIFSRHRGCCICGLKGAGYSFRLAVELTIVHMVDFTWF